ELKSERGARCREEILCDTPPAALCCHRVVAVAKIMPLAGAGPSPLLMGVQHVPVPGRSRSPRKVQKAHGAILWGTAPRRQLPGHEWIPVELERSEWILVSVSSGWATRLRQNFVRTFPDGICEGFQNAQLIPGGERRLQTSALVVGAGGFQQLLPAL